MLSHSQNFINNKKIVKQIINATDLSGSDLIIEIGPGKGIITDELVKLNKRIIAIEADYKFYINLVNKYSYNNIQIINGDFLKFQLPKNKFNIISNIPFNITSDIIKKITSSEYMQEAYLIMQKEAALKYIGMPFFESTMISIFLKIHFDINLLFNINPKNFSPMPKVKIYLVRIKRKNIPFFNSNDEMNFKNFICYIYDRSRPILAEALKKIISQKQINKMFISLRMDRKIKIKQIDFDVWFNIYKIFRTYASPQKQKHIQGYYYRLLKYQQQLQKIHRTTRKN